jgi:hypothetical protein
LLDHLGKPNIVNICCYIIWWPPSELILFQIFPNFKWPIVNYGLFKRLLELSFIYMKKFLGSFWTMKEVCIQTLWHMLNFCADVLRNSLDFEIGVVAHTMRTNHHSRCNVFLFQFKCHTYSDALKYIHPIIKGKIVLE